MKVIYSWLREWVDFDFSPERLAQVFESLGMGVEAIEKDGDEVIYDLEITPNRPDLLGVIGIAREVSAYTGNPLKKRIDFELHTGDGIEVEIENPDDCPRYTASVVSGVSVRPSPDWLSRRLELSGIRSLNNIIDVSNYVLLELGQPIHIFDRESVDRIVVRKAGDGEKILTLDGVERELDHDILVIASSREPIAIAGVMGGELSGVRDTTKDVVVESAFFNHGVIRKGRKKLNINTESSYRFERKADIGIVHIAQSYTVRLLKEICGGQDVSPMVDTNPDYRKGVYVRLDVEGINRLLGTDYSKQDIEETLGRFGFEIQKDKVFVPSFRRDIELPEDLSEEVARLKGYNTIGRRVRTVVNEVAVDENLFLRKFRYVLEGMGLNEVKSLSFMPSGFDPSVKEEVALTNPMWPDRTVMRTTLAYGMLKIAEHNLNRGRAYVQIFEVGRVFRPEEKTMIGVLVAGVFPRRWFAHEREVDFYDIKGIAEGMLVESGLEGYRFVEGERPIYEKGFSLDILVDGERIGDLGMLNQDILDTGAFFIEVESEKLLKNFLRSQEFKGVNRFPFVKRDLSFIIPQGVENSTVVGIIREVGGFVEKVDVLDVYTGKGIPEGCRSITYRIYFRNPQRTLRAEEVEERIEGILVKLKGIDVVLRQ